MKDTDTRKRPATLSIRADILDEAKALKLNASQAAEAGIAAAVKKAKEESWLKQNRAAIDAYNKFIDENGLLLTPYWLEDDGAL